MRILDLTNQYGNDFLQQFHSCGYQIVHGKPVSSRIDPSVHLIGSTISVLKPYLFDAEIPRCVMLQNAIRTQSLRRIEHGQYDNGIYGSYFIAMGTLAPYHQLEETTQLASQFLDGILQGDRSRLLFRVSSSDSDLLQVCKAAGNTELDSRPGRYYRHHYGLDDLHITGRNFNIAVLSDGEFQDVANIIVIERDHEPFAVEFAMGMSTLLTHTLSLKHTMLGNIVADICPMEGPPDYSLGDCVSVVGCLEHEGVRPNGSKMPGRLLKRYKKVLGELCSSTNQDPEKLLSDYAAHFSGIRLPI